MPNCGIHSTVAPIAASNCSSMAGLAKCRSSHTGGNNGLLNIPRTDLSVLGVTLLPTSTPWQYYSFAPLVFVLVFVLVF